MEKDDTDTQDIVTGPSQAEAAAIEQELEEDLRQAPREAELAAGMRSPLGLLVKAMRQYPPIRNRLEFNALFARYKSAANGQERKRIESEIVYRNIGLVIAIAKRYLGNGLPLEDLVQAGIMAMLEGALPRYEHERGLQFSTYATWWIRHGVMREIQDRRTDRPCRVPVHAQERWYFLKKISSRFAAQHSRYPTLKELSEITGLPIDRLEELRVTDSLFNRRPASLDAPFGDSDDTLLDVVDSGIESHEMPLDREWIRTKQSEAMKCLNELGTFREDILKYRFGLGVPIKTLQEIGQGYNLTRERIRQIEADTIARISKRLKVDKAVVSALFQLIGDGDLIPESVRNVHPDTIRGEALDTAYRILTEHLHARTEYKQVSVPAAARTLSHRMEIDLSESRALLELLAVAGRISPVQADESVFLT
ncbi:sigma-70 family RNA polymerase sigma factor [Candidatus Uhrbacteria bacterium]|nr:sigma-70 family RNA polymerase sigma factor [Candidatus Uhrbacteria bacterium]